MSILLEKFRPLEAKRTALVANSGNDPFHVIVERIVSSTEAVVNGRKVIMVGTNNYLGLTFDPDCVAAACKAVKEEGTGTTGSRMANGSYATHVALENELAAFFNCPAAIVFSTGYIANLAVISTLTGPEDVILMDADCHASIYDGTRLGTAQVIRFRHNNPADLEKRLQRLGEQASRTLVVVEGIYSMLGDRAPLREFVDIKNRYGASLLVDEAHSLGVLGEHGRGLAEEAAVEGEVDFITGTFSKSLGSIGGFCVSRLPELEHMRYAMRPYTFTASSSPSLIASTRQALRILSQGVDLRKKLWDNAARLHHGLTEMGFDLGAEISPVIAVKLPVSMEEDPALLWGELLSQGVYVNLVLPPAAPGGNPMLRCSLSAAHSPEQIDIVLEAFATVSAKLQLKCQT
ncbi:MAG: aminotransferase class I/II-fold pyridoxal phosphate-dependent enzyme [Gammaproteobacteria bacterium]|nr:aminotransferase class I/II-fold pyridoxal phosphate-dependent enzyme [Gammaproteobacteria bacterium]